MKIMRQTGQRREGMYRAPGIYPSPAAAVAG